MSIKNYVYLLLSSYIDVFKLKEDIELVYNYYHKMHKLNNY